MKKNVLIIFPLLIVSLLAVISFGYIPANKFNVNSADNLLFHLDSYNFFLFPFQQLVHSFIAHEDFLSICLKYFIHYSPIILLFCCSYLAYGVGAGIIAALIAAILYICEAIDIEQALIAFSLMLVISAYLIKFKTEQRRNVYLAFALFAAMWAKGVCFPFVLGIIIYEFFIAQKFSAKVLSKKWLILVLFLIANIPWTTINYLESPKNKLIFFTEYSGRSASNVITGALGYTQTVEGNIFEAFRYR